ncbi:colanic acid/amylovoran biosynthesis glycosyltransferase [Christiangramia gaetbulicola]|uniref:Colanic acid/amylovoran biosynthesis glycosyltransferase n=1 Tax=Christiangramia gaetbulicola TaxID=703340 RepID=A0A2T6AJU4_9FLAO|nr:glycosyltransferase family 4 protein [Christiangramia gaetbulicola]PTX44080.1 colanic acid/amylovoran biosynthesis glycosyltransferase [Christiangramia gaetbulicola]
MSKTIIFKVWKFPKLSETFVVNQIVLAKKLGYQVKVLVEEVLEIKENANLDIFKQFKIADSIILEDYDIPKNRIWRWIKGAFLLFKNIVYWPGIYKAFRFTKKKNIQLIYQFDFYRKFRNIDIFHIQFGNNKNPVDLLKKCGFLKSNIVVSFHGHDLFFPINNRIPNNGYYNDLFACSSYLIANTPFLKQKLLELGAPESKIKIIPVAIDLDLFCNKKLKGPGEEIKLITIGRLDELKGQKYGIHAVYDLVKKGYDVRYIIAGSGNNISNLRQKVIELKLEKHIVFKGMVNPSEVVKLLKYSDIFLMTSVRNSRGEVESQGLVTAEAQACGLPVVAFRSGGVPHTLEEDRSGFLCEEKDITCFVSKIETLILDKELRKTMGENGREFVEKNFSEKSVIARWNKVYG